MEVEEDAPLEEWTLKELKEECKTLGLSEKGKKAALIERIKEARTTPEEEAAVEEAAVEEIAGEAAPEEAVVEEPETDAVVEEVAEVEDDGPLEEWTVKELKEECKALGVADKGKKAELIERITEARLA